MKPEHARPRGNSPRCEEAATAKSVLDFLQNDLLAQASAAARKRARARDPMRNLTVRTALDRGRARPVAGKFDAQPLVEATIRQTIGTTYQDLGLYPAAQRQMERTLELRRRELGETHDTLTTITQLAENVGPEWTVNTGRPNPSD